MRRPGSVAKKIAHGSVKARGILRKIGKQVPVAADLKFAYIHAAQCDTALLRTVKLFNQVQQR